MTVYDYIINGKTNTVAIDGKSDKFQVSVDDKSLEIEACQLSNHLISLIVDGKLHRVCVAEKDSQIIVHIGGKVIVLDDAGKVSSQQRSDAGASGAALGAITSPMPGNLIKVMVEVGDIVEEGQALVIVEAMKMENEIRSPADGVVKNVNFSVGDLVDPGVSIVELETGDVGESEE